MKIKVFLLMLVLVISIGYFKHSDDKKYLQKGFAKYVVPIGYSIDINSKIDKKSNVTLVYSPIDKLPFKNVLKRILSKHKIKTDHLSCMYDGNFMCFKKDKNNVVSGMLIIRNYGGPGNPNPDNIQNIDADYNNIKNKFKKVYNISFNCKTTLDKQSQNKSDLMTLLANGYNANNRLITYKSCQSNNIKPKIQLDADFVPPGGEIVALYNIEKYKYLDQKKEGLFFSKLFTLEDSIRSPKLVSAKRKKEAFDVLKKIIDSEGADTLTKHNRSLLFHASSSLDAKLVKYLIKKGANVNQADIANVTPLQEAVKSGSIEIVKILVENGADILAEDNFYRSAISIAKNRNQIEIYQYLLSHVKQ